MIQKFNAIGLVICFALAVGVLLERYGTRKQETIETQAKYIKWQDSLINQIRTERDSLRITRAEFDSAVKLLESKK